MKVEYDEKADATYITLKKGAIGFGGVFISKETKDEDIVLDYGADGYLVGIEVLYSGRPDYSSLEATISPEVLVSSNLYVDGKKV